MAMEAAMEADDIENQPTKTSGLKREAARRMWRLLLVCFLYAAGYMSIFIDLENAFVMSLIPCPEPIPNPTCPLGSSLAGDHCEAEPPGSPNWSLSVHCADKHTVMNEARAVMANMGTLTKICGIFSILVLGPLVDILGRKPIMLVGLIGCLLKSGVQEIASRMVGMFVEQKTMLLAGSAIGGFTGSFSTALRAMAADLSGRRAEERAAAFASISFVISFGMGLGFIAGYFVLKMNLTNYQPVWLSSFFMSIFTIACACCLLKETRDTDRIQDARDSESDSDIECSAHLGLRARIMETFSIFKDFLEDRVLGQLILLSTVLAMCSPAEHLSSQVLMGPLGYSQAAASLSNMVAPMVIAAGSATSGVAVRKFGQFRAFALSLVLQALGMLLTGLCMPFEGARETLFWSGTFIDRFSFGVHLPVAQTILSVRVEQAKQGTLFAVVHLVEMVSGMLGLQIFVKHLYNSDWTGWKAGTAFFVAAVVDCFCLLWLAAIARLDRKSVEDGELVSGDEEDSDD
eukprot:TRINITY_DN46078_c0_g1_i1.p1 TRINITY_DN46078_c0_g1~~TRINITY_DN46078_c0_g1_i1.p1  ORF type:complete len:516 (+),score=89.32 TRINITY_DN46078_c0_g1_i1:49-1596(+)